MIALCLFLGVFVSTKGSKANDSENYVAENIELTPEAKYNNQFNIGLSSNIPLDKTSENFKSGQPGIQFEYNSFIKNYWMLGFGAGFQNLKSTGEEPSLVVMKLFQRTRKLFRIYHPFYYGVGFELSYILPSIRYIPEIAEGYNPEVGVGLIKRYYASYRSRFDFII